MKSILSYLTERLVLSKNKTNEHVTIEDFIIWAGGYESINEWTYEQFEENQIIMSEECLARKCHDNLYELYEYIIENLDTIVDISNPKYDGYTYFYKVKIGKYDFELSAVQEYGTEW